MAAEMVKEFRLRANELGLILPGPAQPGAAAQDISAVVTLASIIEKETSVPDERPEVAGVYCEPPATPHPPASRPQRDLRRAAARHLHRRSAPCRHALRLRPTTLTATPGCRPGPIANPGKSSLQAAMHPAQTAYYYFVSDGNGHHRFAATLEEHNRNVAALRRVDVTKVTPAATLTARWGYQSQNSGQRRRFGSSILDSHLIHEAMPLSRYLAVLVHFGDPPLGGCLFSHPPGGAGRTWLP